MDIVAMVIGTCLGLAFFKLFSGVIDSDLETKRKLRELTNTRP